jgi:hypothetical protein
VDPADFDTSNGSQRTSPPVPLPTNPGDAVFICEGQYTDAIGPPTGYSLLGFFAGTTGAPFYANLSGICAWKDNPTTNETPGPWDSGGSQSTAATLTLRTTV